MNKDQFDYDVVVIGSGPAGQKSAIQAAKAGERVAIIERDSLFGGGLCSSRYDSLKNITRKCITR